MSDTYNLWDVPLSPVYGIAETLGRFPVIRDTEFSDWLEQAPVFSGARTFREQAPGWAAGFDFATSFIPYIGWAGRLGKAAQTANMGRGLLGLTNRLGVQAGRAAGGGAIGEALGSAVLYAPPSAAITGFDVLGDRYENPYDAATGLVLGTALGAGLQAGGRALTPAVRGLFPPSAAQVAEGQFESTIAKDWRNIFEPPPQLLAMGGFSANIRRQAAEASRSPRFQEALDPSLEPQMMHRELLGVRQQLRDGLVQGIDPAIVESQIDAAVRQTVAQKPADFEDVIDWGPEPSDNPRTQQWARWSLRYGPDPENTGSHIRLSLEGPESQINNPQTLAEHLRLPEDWLADIKWGGVSQVASSHANTYARLLNLPDRPAPGFNDSNAPWGENFRRVTRVLPDKTEQTWVARRDIDNGLWTLATEIPGEHRMTARSLFPNLKRKDTREAARAYFTFKTDRPARFIPEAFTDLDNAGPDALWHRRVNLDTTRSQLLKQILDYEDVYLNPKTVKSIQRSIYGPKENREKFVRTVLGSPTAGEHIMQNIRHVAAPTVQQFKDNAVASGTWGLYRTVMEGVESRVRQQLHGKAVISADKSPLASIFSAPGLDDAEALVPALRRMIMSEPDQLEIIRQYLKRNDKTLEDLDGTSAGAWLRQLHKVADDVNLKDYNAGIESLRKIGATNARSIPFRGKHAGVSHSWDGSIFVPIYKAGNINPSAAIAGGSLKQAQQKAQAWLKAVAQEEPDVQYRVGNAFVPGGTETPPGWLTRMAGNPGFLQPRGTLRGYEHEFEPYKHVDDFIAELEDNFLRRARYFGRVAADALTVSQRNQIRLLDPKLWQLLETRTAQLTGQPIAAEVWQNKVLDQALAPYLGTNSASKLSEAVNETMFHSLYLGHVGAPTLNLTSMFQTHIPAALEMLTSRPDQLRHFGYWLPWMDEAGRARPGMHFVPDAFGLWWGGIRRAMNPSEGDREVFEHVFNNKIIGGFMNEYTGQDRTLAARASEKLRGPEDLLFWFRQVSGILMQKSTQVSRTFATGMALETMDRLEKAFRVKFSSGQRIHNATTMVERADYNYFKQDRPLMFTSPLGSVFGNQKTWMVNYLWMLAHYFGLAKQGQWEPLLFSLGTTAALGGAFAVPLLGQGIDAFAGLTEDKDGREWIFDHMGEGGNAIAFGLPALFGLSMSENVAAPGANLTHDAEFLFSIIALEKAKQLGRAVGRGLEDATTLGINPFEDPLFARQVGQTFAPRALYRSWEALQEGPLRSAATGYPMVRDFGLGARVLHGLGFRDVDIAIQYEAYRHLIKDKEEMNRQVGAFGEAYARASLNNDRETMTELLQRAAVMGISIDSVMRSAQVRMRNEGMDMFGRNFSQSLQDRYRETLEAGGAQ